MSIAKRSTSPPQPIAKPPPVKFKAAARVNFNDRDNLPVTGKRSRVNHRSVTVTPDNKDGRWRVSAALLRRRVDL